MGKKKGPKLTDEQKQRLRELRQILREYINKGPKSTESVDPKTGEKAPTNRYSRPVDVPEEVMEALKEIMAHHQKLPDGWERILRDYQAETDKVYERLSTEEAGQLNELLKELGRGKDIDTRNLSKPLRKALQDLKEARQSLTTHLMNAYRDMLQEQQEQDEQQDDQSDDQQDGDESGDEGDEQGDEADGDDESGSENSDSEGGKKSSKSSSGTDPTDPKNSEDDKSSPDNLEDRDKGAEADQNDEDGKGNESNESDEDNGSDFEEGSDGDGDGDGDDEADDLADAEEGAGDDGEDGDDGDAPADGLEAPPVPPPGVYNINEHEADPEDVAEIIRCQSVMMTNDPDDPSRLPRWNKKELIRRVLTFRDPTPARRPTLAPIAVANIIDNSGSMGPFEKEVAGMGAALGEASKEMDSAILTVLSSNGEYACRGFSTSKDNGHWWLNGTYMGLLPNPQDFGFGSNVINPKSHAHKWEWFFSYFLPRIHNIDVKIICAFADGHPGFQLCYISNKLRKVQMVWFDPSNLQGKTEPVVEDSQRCPTKDAFTAEPDIPNASQLKGNLLKQYPGTPYGTFRGRIFARVKSIKAVIEVWHIIARF